MNYHVTYSKHAFKQLQKMDKFDARLITSWIRKNLEGCADPRIHGKALAGNLGDLWRYRVGNYRILATISDTQITIHIAEIGHRKNIYTRK
ncbi:MAG: type II toxin-antitoxin system RelE/ParE family toxin [Eggerthellaceae bacterium]|nr:type II toxin-antitoxin system RelE/ParE family toxin [Eggerthellaceae bacterium]